MVNLSERVLFHNMTVHHSFEASLVQPYETGVHGAIVLDSNAVSISIPIGRRYAHHPGGRPTKHHPRISYRFPVGSAHALNNARLRGHNALTCREPGLSSLRLPAGGRERNSEYQNLVILHRLHSIRITRPFMLLEL